MFKLLEWKAFWWIFQPTFSLLYAKKSCSLHQVLTVRYNNKVAYVDIIISVK